MKPITADESYKVVQHLKESIRKAFPDLSEHIIDESVATRYHDKGNWCKDYGVATINFECGIPTWAYSDYVYNWCINDRTLPEGYYIEFINDAIAVVYREQFEEE